MYKWEALRSAQTRKEQLYKYSGSWTTTTSTSHRCTLIHSVWILYRYNVLFFWLTEFVSVEIQMGRNWRMRSVTSSDLRVSLRNKLWMREKKTINDENLLTKFMFPRYGLCLVYLHDRIYDRMQFGVGKQKSEVLESSVIWRFASVLEKSHFLQQTVWYN